MSLVDLVPEVQSLPREDKLRLMQILVMDLARQDGIPLVEPGVTHSIWSPHEATEAAATMLQSL